MRRIKIALLLAVGLALFGCNTPTSAPPASPASNQPGAAAKTAATTSSVNFVLDPGLKTMVPTVGVGVTVTYDPPIGFPLTSPCSEGAGPGLKSCTTNNVKGIFPYICDNDACPDPEILVDTGDTGTKGGKPPKTAISGRKKGSNINVPKKMYVECISSVLKTFPDDLVVSKGTEIYWVSSGATPTTDWVMSTVPRACKETTISYGKGNNLCTAQNPTHMPEPFTISAVSCNNSSVSGTLEVQ